ncbi:MAG: hypothetical protein KH972_02130 [Peptostreptococcaceae bacterium]|nr:hypothetical protein [Peptostreptococcaceae bacterium]
MNDLIITKQGQSLIAKMIAGTDTAKFTKLQTSSHDYTSDSLELLSELTEVKQEVEVSSVKKTDTSLVQVVAAIDNKEIVDGYYVRTIGLFAKDSKQNEILYAIATDDKPDYMPAFGGKTVSGISYRLNTKVDVANQVIIELNPANSATIEQVENLEKVVNTHIEKSVVGEEGVHGLRYFDDELQVKGLEGWASAGTGGSGIAPSNVVGAKVKVGNQKLTISWSDPNNTVVGGQTLCTWKGTKLVQKVGSYPENAKDGILLVDNQIKDKYKDSGFEIPNLVNGQTYYFALFPYSDTGSVNLSAENRLVGKPQPFRKMTVKIDLSNSNPATCCSYHDDAAEMIPGSKEWDDFFGHYPCLFKNGQEVGKLKRDNFFQFEDGKSADITSGDAGDVMIAFPRRGVKISTSGDIVTVSMTDDPDNSEFKYYAHTKKTARKEVFYLGAYKGWKDGSNKLRSLKDKAPTANQTIGRFRTQAQANGSGYEQSAFFQLTFRQVMYLLKYKNLDSQTTIGQGYVKSGQSSPINTGGSENYGMDSEIIKKSNPSYMTDQGHHVKLFGLEDFWGNIYECIDGIVTDSSRNILTATGSYNNSGSGYDNNGNAGSSSNVLGFMSKPNGTTELGFTLKETKGSETTYFSDYAYLSADGIACFGGEWSNTAYAGVFRLNVSYSPSFANSNFAGRLMYL